MKITLKNSNKKKSKAQSLIELSLALLVLLTLLSGMVEVGMALNIYINLVDGARTVARELSIYDPLADPAAFKLQTPTLVNQILPPIKLKPAAPASDDLLVSIYSVEKGKTSKKLSDVSFKVYDNQESKFNASNVTARLNSSAPNTGVVVVEIFYAHYQVLNFPFLGFFNPIRMYAYSIMPMTSAEPTPTP